MTSAPKIKLKVDRSKMVIGSGTKKPILNFKVA